MIADVAAECDTKRTVAHLPHVGGGDDSLIARCRNTASGCNYIQLEPRSRNFLGRGSSDGRGNSLEDPLEAHGFFAATSFSASCTRSDSKPLLSQCASPRFIS